MTSINKIILETLNGEMWPMGLVIAQEIQNRQHNAVTIQPPANYEADYVRQINIEEDETGEFEIVF